MFVQNVALRIYLFPEISYYIFFT